MSSFKSSMNDIKHQIVDIKQENLQYKCQLEQQKQKLDKYEKENGKLTKEMKNLRLDYNHLEECQQETDEFLKKAQQENCLSCESLCRLEADNSDKERENFELQKQLETYEYALKNLESEYHSTFTEQKGLEEQYAQLQEEIISTNEQFEIMKKEKNDNDIEWKVKVDQLNTKLSSYSSENGGMKQAIENKEKTINDLNDEVSTLTAKNVQIRAKKRKFKILKDKLREKNNLQAIKLTEAEKVKTSLEESETENKNISAEFNDLNIKFQNQCQTIKLMREEIQTLRQDNMGYEDHVRQLTETQNLLNKSIGDLGNSNEIKEGKIKNMENDGKYKINTFEKLTMRLKSTVRKLELDLDMTRCELKDRRKEVSELKHDNLEKEFKIQEIQRVAKEKETALNIKEKEEQNLIKRNQDLSTELAITKEKQKVIIKHEEEKKKHDVVESNAMMKLITNMKIRREENIVSDQHQRTVQEQNNKIAELERLWKDEQSNLRAERIEKSYLQEELERIRLKNISKLKENNTGKTLRN